MNKTSRYFSRLFQRVSLQDRINFARHLSIVVKAGIPVFTGLRIIRSQAGSKTLKRILDDAITDVSNGRLLSDSLERRRDIFGEFFVNIIRVGEASGTLAQNLLYLAEEMKKSKSLKSKVRSAMVYPAVILVATIAVTAFLTFFVFPKLLPVLLGLGVKLPATTLALISIVDFLTRYGIITVVGTILIIFIVRMLLKHVQLLRYAVNEAIIFLPTIGNLIISLNVVNMCRVLALLLKSGTNIVEALAITASTFNNPIYKKLIDEAGEEMKKGGQLALFFSRHKNFIPTLVSGMVEIGEDTGNLEDNLSYLAEYYSEEVEYKLQDFTSILEPLMLLIMGLLVGFVAISIITPIYSISQGIK